MSLQIKNIITVKVILSLLYPVHSETTLESSSTVSISRMKPDKQKISSVYSREKEAQGRPTSRSIFNQVREDTFKPDLVPHTPVRPEDDILYQWRLARKIEKAQQSTSVYPALYSRTSDLGRRLSTRETDRTTRLPPQSDLEFVPTRLDRPETYRPTTVSKDKSRTEMDSKSKNFADEFGEQQHLYSNETDRDQFTTDHQEKSKEVTVQTPLEYSCPLSSSKAKLEVVDLPSHMHMMCDILPCSHQRDIVKQSRTGGMKSCIPIAPPVVDFTGEQAVSKRRVTDTSSSSSSSSTEKSSAEQEALVIETMESQKYKQRGSNLEKGTKDPLAFASRSFSDVHQTETSEPIMKKDDKLKSNKGKRTDAVSLKQKSSRIGNAINQVSKHWFSLLYMYVTSASLF